MTTYTGTVNDDAITGTDNFYAGASATNTVGAGNDTIDGGTITDTLNGVNSDRASFSNAGTSVTVNLVPGTAGAWPAPIRQATTSCATSTLCRAEIRTTSSPARTAPT